jgi:hypothetical protein
MLFILAIIIGILFALAALIALGVIAIIVGAYLFSWYFIFCQKIEEIEKRIEREKEQQQETELQARRDAMVQEKIRIKRIHIQAKTSRYN